MQTDSLLCEAVGAEKKSALSHKTHYDTKKMDEIDCVKPVVVE
jgi:hypothetical protein